MIQALHADELVTGPGGYFPVRVRLPVEPSPARLESGRWSESDRTAENATTEDGPNAGHSQSNHDCPNGATPDDRGSAPVEQSPMAEHRQGAWPAGWNP